MPVIRSGRCDECRRRKRKCDESQPSCSNCTARNVGCRYSCEVSRFVLLHQTEQGSSSESDSLITSRSNTPADETVLSIRSRKAPPSGCGLYHTLKVYPKLAHKKANPEGQKIPGPEIRLLSISPPPLSDICKLQNEFGSILHSADTPGLHMSLLGSWLEMALQRIGTSVALDSAIACLVTGHKGKYSGSSRTAEIGRRRYIESLTLLKTALAHGAQTVTAELIAATKLLMIYELLAGSEVLGWISHSFGVINLFVAAGPKFCSGDFERKLYYGTHAQAWQQAMMIGKPSVFDTENWLNIEPFVGDLPGNGLSSGARKRQARVITRLSRFIILVRNARERPHDPQGMQEAVSIAEELIDSCWIDCEVFRLVPSIVPTARTQDAELVPLSFQYRESDFSEVILWCYAWCCKIMVSGLCQTLIAYGAALKGPTLAELYKEERRCAMLLCMHVDYAASLVPYGCAPMILCCQIAWGVYWRQKDLHPDINGYAMPDWLLRRGNNFMRYWNAFEMQAEGMIFFTERLMGGPILSPGQNNHGKSISALTSMPTDNDLGEVTAMPRSDQHSTCLNDSATTDEHRFGRGIQGWLNGTQTEVEMRSLFESSLYSTRCEMKQIWRENDFKRST